jgi:hypothetical protein
MSGATSVHYDKSEIRVKYFRITQLIKLTTEMPKRQQLGLLKL